MLENDVQKELTIVASKSRGNSCLREQNLEALETFSWEKLHSELSSTAPTFYRILCGFVNVQQQKRASKKKSKYQCQSNMSVLGVCAALLLRHRNRYLNLVQKIISLILHSGHASKQVLFKHGYHKQCAWLNSNAIVISIHYSCTLRSLFLAGT